jgi:rhodanese-related sulfurtransferase
MMKINYKLCFIIILTGCVLGLFYNYLNPAGINLFNENKIIKWAHDSLFLSSVHSGDSLKQSIHLNQNIEDKTALPKYSESKPRAPINKTELKNKKDDTDEGGLVEPLKINLEQAYKLYGMGGVLFIDARDEEDYASGHIKNSINVPFNAFDKFVPRLFEVSKTRTIVSYCGGADCDLSELLAKRLFKQGYHDIYIFFGGWGLWKTAGYPVE